MNSKQIQLLSKMKKLISEKHRRFEARKDRDYLEELLEIGIKEEEAWNYILSLNSFFYFPDPKPNYSVIGESLTFKRKINGMIIYIKLKIENTSGEEETVCLSFHKDDKNRRF